jgi:hypothetical protein
MAPFKAPNKKEVLNTLQHHNGGPIEITLGMYSPQFIIRYANGQYELLRLILNKAKAEKAAVQRLAEGCYQPEMDWQFLKPGDPIFLELNIESFILKLNSWPGWADIQ